MATATVAAIFLLSAFLKANDPWEFLAVLFSYMALGVAWQAKAMAVAIIILEAAIGSTLLFRLKPRRGLLAASALLVIFLAVLGWAWYHGRTDDCGCFGHWTRSPAEALVEDVLLLLLVGFAAWAESGETRLPRWRMASAGVLVAACLGLLAWHGLDTSARYVDGVGEAPFRRFYVTDLPFDLAHGRYLVSVFSTACPHCQAVAPDWNGLAADRRLPPLALLAFQTRGTRQRFHEYFHLQAPLGHLSTHAASMLVKVRYPKFFLIKDGITQQAWEDGVTPTPEQVLEAVRKGGA